MYGQRRAAGPPSSVPALELYLARLLCTSTAVLSALECTVAWNKAPYATQTHGHIIPLLGSVWEEHVDAARAVQL